MKTRPFKLTVEELETRLVPSTFPLYYSSNWSGYAVLTAPGAVTGVSASWVVPSVTGKGTAYSATWVGIDGFSSSTVEQIGTDSDVVNGKATYYAWWEMYPANAMQEITTFAVHAGDTITASVVYVGGNSFKMTITDANDPAGQNSFTITSSLNGPVQQSSAEWIEEAPSSSSGVLTLAKFSPVTFSAATATISGATGSIASSAALSGDSGAVMDMASFSYNRRTREYVVSQVLDATSALSSTGDSFTVAYGSSTPNAPPGDPSGSRKAAAAMLVSAASAEVAPLPIFAGLPSMAGSSSALPALPIATHGTFDVATAINPTQGGLPASAERSIEVGAGLAATVTGEEDGVQWFLPAPGSKAIAPPALLPSEETTEGMQLGTNLSWTPTQPYLAASLGEPGSMREYDPAFGTEPPAERSAMAVALVALALSGPQVNSQRQQLARDAKREGAPDRAN